MKAKISFLQNVLSLLAVVALFLPVFAIGVQVKTKSKPLNEDQKILHVLNRLGFGGNQADIAKVKAIGINKYIEQQLNASSTDSPEISAKLKNFEVLKMSTSEIFAKYPNPGALLRQLEGKNKRNQAVAENPQNPEAMSDEQRRERQQQIREIYKEYDLRPANQIIFQQASSRIIRAVYSENQLQEQMIDFWMNHFNVYAGKAAVRWYIPSYERDVIRKNALGNFRDLLVGTAQHPAMLFYLDNFQSISPTAQTANDRPQNALQQALRSGKLNPRQRERLRNNGLSDEQIEQRIERAKKMAENQQKNRRGLNENYARELMELHTLGVDGGYTQKDILEVARAFSGWTIADPRGYRKIAANTIQGKENQQLNKIQRQMGMEDELESGEFYFNEKWHDKDVKNVLGQKVDEGGINDGLRVIDILMANPSTAKFIARKLAVKFVSDNPSEALVNRVAKAFQTSKGDIKTTLRAIFNDPEFFSSENYRAKIKTPFELLVSSLRALNADVNTSPALLGFLQKMGEPLYGYQAPTGYSEKAEDWVNTGGLLERMNFAVALASNQIPQTKVNLSKFEANSRMEILNKTIDQILGGEISGATKGTLLKQIEKPLAESPMQAETSEKAVMPRGGGKLGINRQNRKLSPTGNPEVFKIVGLLIGSPDFQRQ